MTRTLSLLFGVVLLVAVGLDTASAQDPPPATPVRYPYEFGLSSVTMLRHVQVFNLAGALADRGIVTVLDKATAHLFEKPGAKGVAARAARVFFVAMPLASLALGFDHEYGHIARDPQPDLWTVRVTHLPWPVPMAGFRIEPISGPGTIPILSFDERQMMTAVAAGSEADHLMADAVADRMYATNAGSPFDIALYTYAKLYPSIYAIATDDAWGSPNDPASFSREVAQLLYLPLHGMPASAPDAVLHSVKKGAWLNMLDYALLGNVHAVLVDYVVRGRPVLHPRWLTLGGLRFAPGLNFTITPAGSQYRINSHVGAGSIVANAYVRWTEPLQADDLRQRVQLIEQLAAQRHYTVNIVVPHVVRLLGAGGQVHGKPIGRFEPTLAADGWRDIDGHKGGRLELGVTVHQRWFGDTTGLRVSIGGKSAGYLPGFPQERGAYLNAALLASF